MFLEQLMSFRTTFTTLKILPELFPLIASHLPLYATPTALLSLALTNREIYDIVHNLLYSRLILRNEKDTLFTFQRILANRELGHAVRELHVMTELSSGTRNGENTDAVTGLIGLINGGFLPYIHSLTFHLLGDWRIDNKCRDVKGFGHFPSYFWENLRGNCPRLRTMVLSGFGDRRHDPWLNDSGVYDLKGMQGLSHLGLTFFPGAQVQQDGADKLLRNLGHLTSFLHTLDLDFNIGYNSASPILALDFPLLRSLTLGSFSVPDTMEAMEFWRRHPFIEKLKLPKTSRQDHWFSETTETDFLPKLKFLEANFHDVRALLPILPRLTGLSIQQSLNAQVPYLLRVLIPAGLSNLASLEIDQKQWAERSSEGSLWYETLDGKFHEEKTIRNAMRAFTDDYIHSIVKGAPNIKELCLHGVPLHPRWMEKLIPELAEFAKLERLYFRGVNDLSLRTPENWEAFYTSSRAIADKCMSLERITDISASPYFAAKIQRSESGVLESVIPAEGYGMTIGSDAEAFPRNPTYSHTSFYTHNDNYE